MSTTPTILPIVKHLYRRYKYDAIKRGKLFDLSLEIFATIIECDCHYCGKAPGQIYCQRGQYKVDTLVYNGIDRKDNDLGYVAGNVVPCCKACNQLKKDRPVEYLSAKLYELHARSQVIRRQVRIQENKPMNHTMYVVKNEAGEYYSWIEYKAEWISYHLLTDTSFLDTLYEAREIARSVGGQVYQVTLTISDTPVTVSEPF